MAKKNLSKKDIKIWKQRIEVSDNDFKKRMEDNIKKWVCYYRGDSSIWKEEWNNQSRCQSIVNMVFANIKTILPSVNFNNPEIMVTPKKSSFPVIDETSPAGQSTIFDTGQASIYIELLLNYFFEELRIKETEKKVILDALIGPWGIVKIGYFIDIDKFSSDGTMIDMDQLKQAEYPFVTRVSPFDFRVDIEATDSNLLDAEWIAFKWIKRLEDVKNNRNFKNTSNLKPNFNMDIKNNSKNLDIFEIAASDDNNIDSEDDEWKRVQGWEIWDKRNKKIINLVMEHESVLQYDDWPIEYEGFPVEVIYFNENPDSLYPVSDIEIYRNQQDVLNIIRSKQIDHVHRISDRKILAQEGTINETEKEKLVYGPSGTVVNIEGTPDSIFPLKDSPISFDTHQIFTAVKNDTREISGVSAFEAGVSTPKADTATELSLINSGAVVKRQERLNIVEEFTKRIIEKLFDVLKQTLDIEVEVQQTNQSIKRLENILGTKAGAEVAKWIKLTRKDIVGDYNFKISVGSMQPVNSETKKRDAVQLMQLLAASPVINSRILVKNILDAFKIKDIDSILKTEEQIAQQQQQAAQLQQQQELAAQLVKSRVDLEKTKMKTDTAKIIQQLKNKSSEKTEGLKSLQDFLKIRNSK